VRRPSRRPRRGGCGAPCRCRGASPARRVPAPGGSTPPVPPPAEQRAVARQPTALHLPALPLVMPLRLLALRRLAARAAPRRYTAESLLRRIGDLRYYRLLADLVSGR